MTPGLTAQRWLWKYCFRVKFLQAANLELVVNVPLTSDTTFYKFSKVAVCAFPVLHSFCAVELLLVTLVFTANRSYV